MNIAQMMKQAQQLQKKMSDLQEQLAAEEMTGVSGGGLVRITITGKYETRAVQIDKTLINPEESDILEDLIMAAFNDARAQIDARASTEMGKVTGGMNLPAGMKLPF